MGLSSNKLGAKQINWEERRRTLSPFIPFPFLLRIFPRGQKVGISLSLWHHPSPHTFLSGKKEEQRGGGGGRKGFDPSFLLLPFLLRKTNAHYSTLTYGGEEVRHWNNNENEEEGWGGGGCPERGLTKVSEIARLKCVVFHRERLKK